MGQDAGEVGARGLAPEEENKSAEQLRAEIEETREGLGDTAVAADLLDDGRGTVSVEIGRDHGSPVRGEEEGDRTADAGAGPGDDGGSVADVVAGHGVS